MKTCERLRAASGVPSVGKSGVYHVANLLLAAAPPPRIGGLFRSLQHIVAYRTASSIEWRNMQGHHITNTHQRQEYACVFMHDRSYRGGGVVVAIGVAGPSLRWYFTKSLFIGVSFVRLAIGSIYIAGHPFHRGGIIRYFSD
jgi:hypothetical protein